MGQSSSSGSGVGSGSGFGSGAGSSPPTSPNSASARFIRAIWTERLLARPVSKAWSSVTALQGQPVGLEDGPVHLAILVAHQDVGQLLGGEGTRVPVHRRQARAEGGGELVVAGRRGQGGEGRHLGGAAGRELLGQARPPLGAQPLAHQHVDGGGVVEPARRRGPRVGFRPRGRGPGARRRCPAGPRRGRRRRPCSGRRPVPVGKSRRVGPRRRSAACPRPPSGRRGAWSAPRGSCASGRGRRGRRSPTSTRPPGSASVSSWSPSRPPSFAASRWERGTRSARAQPGGSRRLRQCGLASPIGVA